MALEIPVDGTYIRDFGAEYVRELSDEEAWELLVDHGCIESVEQSEAWAVNPCNAFLNKGFRLLCHEGADALAVYQHDGKFSLRRIPLLGLIESASQRKPGDRIYEWVRAHIQEGA